MDDEPEYFSPELVEDLGWDERVSQLAREAARAEIASLAGLVLRRLQDEGPTRSPERNMAVEVMAKIFGEALRDFSASENEPGV